MSLKVPAASLLYITLFWSKPSLAVEISSQVERIGDATHLEFTGQTQWIYQIRRDKGARKVILELPPMNSEAQQRLQSWKDPLIEDIKISQKGVDGSHTATIELASADVEFFDYVTDQPSRLIVDFFRPEESKPVSNSPIEVSTKSSALTQALPKKEKNKKGNSARRSSKTLGRKPAGTDYLVAGTDLPKKEIQSQAKPQDDEALLKSLERGLFDGGDPTYERFRVSDYEIDEKAIIAAKKNIYIKFPYLDDRSTGLEELFSQPVEYEIKSQKTEENKMARLLLTLYKNKRPAVYLKTQKFFRQKYPVSQYDQIIDHLTADVYYDIWKKEASPADFQQAISMYQSLVQRYPDSPLAERTQLLVGRAFLERGDSLGTLKIFERFRRERPESIYTDQVSMIIASTYKQLNKYELAIQELNNLEEKAKNPAFGRRAAFTRGDVYFQMGEYKGAISEYELAMAKYPDHLQDHPNAFYNRSEALFWLEQYKKSVESFREFAIRFPSHQHNAYALTRIGENMEILGVAEPRYMGAFFESHYRFKGTGGAHVAWLRLLRKRMVGMKETEITAAVNKVMEDAKESDLPFFEDFTTLMIADGLFNRRQYSKALSYLMNFYQKNPTSSNLAVFEDRILRTIAESIRYHVDKGSFLAALKIYGRHADTWLRKSGRIDVNYYLGRSFEIAGVYKEAAEIYFGALNSLYALVGTKAEKERTVFEVLPTTDELNLRLAAVQVKLENYNKAGEYLANIHQTSEFSEEEYLEKVQLSVEVAKAQHNTREAKKYLQQLAQIWKAQPHRVSVTTLQLAKLQIEDSEFSEAEASLNSILLLQQDTRSVAPNIHGEALELKGRVLQRQGRSADAVLYFEKLLETYGDAESYDPLRYETGKILFGLGQGKDAERVWKPLGQRKDSIWAKMADSRRSEQVWNQDYKKYIDRIPAMAGSLPKEGN
jgi:tetratricopeptide (TPR) repeat protein